jgi:putative acetyltransferase
MLLRPETAADHAAIHALVRAAFGQADEADLVDRLRADGEVVVSVVADDGGNIAGHVLLSRMAAPVGTLGLAPVSVAPEMQGRGVGSALIRAAIAEARAAGWTAIFVLGEQAYYGRFGFSVEAARGFTSPYAGDHFAMLALNEDAANLGGTADYPAAFAALD